MKSRKNTSSNNASTQGFARYYPRACQGVFLIGHAHHIPPPKPVGTVGTLALVRA